MTAKAYNPRTDAELLASIGERLRAFRKAHELTQDEAAARAGLARSTVSEAENGGTPHSSTPSSACSASTTGSTRSRGSRLPPP